MTEYYSATWRIIIRQVGKVLFGKLVREDIHFLEQMRFGVYIIQKKKGGTKKREKKTFFDLIFCLEGIYLL